MDLCVYNKENIEIENNTIIINICSKTNIEINLKKIILENKIENIIFYFNKNKLKTLNNFNISELNIKSIILDYSNISISDIYANKYHFITTIFNLPNNLESFEIIDNHNYRELKLDPSSFKNLPPKLKKLKISSYNTIELNNLPNTLEILDISISSNYPNKLDYLPSSLKSINLTIIQYLIINSNINIKINLDSLPSGLEDLIIIGYYHSDLNCLPINLKKLHLPSEYTNKIINVPENLEELKIPLEYKYLDNFKNCKKLKKIIIGFSYMYNIYTNSYFNINSIPQTIEEIKFGDTFNQSIEFFPPKIKKITFGYNFNPDSISIPDTIEYIEFGYKFNGIIKKYSSNLKYLKFGMNYNKEINNLPVILKIFEFDECEEYKLDISNIPESVEIIKLGKYMISNKINLPKNLKKITYSKLNDWITQKLEENKFTGIINLI